MKRGVVSTIVVCAAIVNARTSSASAVDLELRPSASVINAGEVVEVGLFAVSSSETPFIAMDVVLTWDQEALRFLDVLNNGPQNWGFLVPGLYPDSARDGLNDSVLDGDAFLQAATFSSATATPAGLLVATLRFEGIWDTESANIMIVPRRGKTSKTLVVQTSAIDVTGRLGAVDITILADARLSVGPVMIPAGRMSDAIVFGEIMGKDSFGATLLLEIVPQAGATGTVTFSPATLPSDVDIVQLGSPWGTAGSFNPLDTDLSNSDARNGALFDNGSFLPSPTTFMGPLAAFPLVTSGDALGEWEIRLSTSDGDKSLWWRGLDPLLMALRPGVLRIVDLGDGDGGSTIDLHDLSQFQACFSGPGGPIDPLGQMDPGTPPCTVYDFDGDQDVDDQDFGAFQAVLLGPAP